MPNKMKQTEKVIETQPTLKRQKAIAPKVSPLAKWQSHLKSYREKNPDKSLKMCMQEAKESYRK